MIPYNHQIPLFEEEPIVIKTIHGNTRIIAFMPIFDQYVFVDTNNDAVVYCYPEEILEWEYMKPEIMQMHFAERMMFAQDVIEQTKPSKLRLVWYRLISWFYQP